MPIPNPQADHLRALFARGELISMPCCYDGLSVRLIEQAGFEFSFLSGFAAAARFGAHDTGLMSYGETLDQARSAMEGTTLPMMVDGDTGHGNVPHVERTVEGFARAGAPGVMVEDQRAPKRCGHTEGKSVVDREGALDPIRAATCARARRDAVILARTDARREHGLAEAIARAQSVAALGADMAIVEEPLNADEMRTICAEVPAPSLANILEGGQTPIPPPAELAGSGFAVAAYPIAALSSAMRAIADALALPRAG